MTRRPLVVALAAIVSLALAMPAGADVVAGIEGPVFGASVVSRGLEATGQKPESKLFFTQDGRWWAALGFGNVATPGVYLLELTEAGWVPRLRLAASDPWSKADTLYVADASTLWVSLRDNMATTETNPRRSTLHRLTYDGAGGWTEPGPPLTITTAAPETITIARDSAGRIWTAFEQNRRIRAGYLAPGGTAFAFWTLSQTDVTNDDIASIVTFGEPGNYSVGVFWSDQVTDRFLFTVRRDGASLARTSFKLEVVYGGGVGGCPTAASDLCADDHLNVTSTGARVLVAVKTSLNDAPAPDPGDPLIVLLKRAGGIWSTTEVSDVAANFTRPIVLADPGSDTVRVFASVLNGDTYAWAGPLSVPSFGAPEPWTVADGTVLSNPTSTKQNVSSATGYVVMTSTPKSPYVYWYGHVAGV